MTLTKVCSLGAVQSGTMRQFSLKDHEVLIINRDGQITCLDARCTHAGAPLEEGSVENDILTCPWHGSQFNVIDGSVVRGPAEKPLKSYTVTVGEGWVFIDV